MFTFRLLQYSLREGPGEVYGAGPSILVACKDGGEGISSISEIAQMRDTAVLAMSSISTRLRNC